MENNERKNNSLTELMEASMSKIRDMIDVNTVVGDPITTPGGVTIIPVSKVSVGFGGGGSDFTRKTAAGDNPFGGGVGGLRGVCGAVSGMAMVYGMLCGYDRPEEKAGKKAEYAAIQRMANRFREAEEAIDCRPLLERAGIDPSNMPSERDPEYYAKRPCPRLVREAAAILADELNAQGFGAPSQTPAGA